MGSRTSHSSKKLSRLPDQLGISRSDGRKSIGIVGVARGFLEGSALMLELGRAGGEMVVAGRT